MKITKAFIKSVILEELNKISEQENQFQSGFMNQPAQVQQKQDPAQQKKELQGLLAKTKADLLAAKAAVTTISTLEQKIKDINDQLSKIG